ncbi:MAG: magnesium chelatase subunit D [Gammaproteobacteria bacterium]
MPETENNSADPHFNAMQALLVYAIDPVGCGGLHLCGLPGPGRDAVLRLVARAQAASAPYIRIPCHIGDDRLLGGLDLAATLAAGKPVSARGLLASADAGVAVFVMAERLPRRTVAHVVNVMDTRHIQLERDGFSDTVPARFAVVALDESLEEDEFLNPALADRLAFRIWTDHLNAVDVDELPVSPDELQHAREGLRDVNMSDEILTAICNTALGLGILSLRSVLQCVHSARALAALAGSETVNDEHAAAAVRLVLAHRALQLPPPAESETESEPEPEQQTSEPENNEEHDRGDAQMLDDMLVEAATAVLPSGILDALSREAKRQKQKKAAGRAGAKAKAVLRGRPIGDMPADKSDARLNVLATLKTAAPWQRIRNAPSGRVAIRREDFRVTRLKSKSQTTNIFVVDASGSSAAQRLGEVKGAVELLLADCYVRRDQVALIGFRGNSAELLLSPTRSLVRAKRELANLPGGGATPLASAIDTARELAQNIERQGQRPLVILMTDGRGNVGRDGTPGHADCKEHTEAAARDMAEAGVQTLLVDVSRRPRPRGSELAEALGGNYLALPFASAESISQSVKSVGAAL